MIRYKMDVDAELKKHGFNSLTAKQTKLFGQSTMTKLKRGDTNLSIDVISKICAILSIQPGDLLEYVPDDSETRYMEYFKKYEK